jgi:tetratricopeptide (TPR) repeat protein
MGQGDRTYRGFVSYSHKDAATGLALHRKLERYSVPRRLRSDNTRTAALGRFFRDREELAANEHLTGQIRSALEKSESLIVLCSPGSAASKWVAKEIETFREVHPGGEIFAVILDGDPPECFPAPLREMDIVAADLRKQGDGQEGGFLKLVSGLLGVGFAELKDREAERTRERMRRTAMIAGAFAVVAVGALLGLAGTLFFADRTTKLANAAIETSGEISDEALKMALNSGANYSSVLNLLNLSQHRLGELQKFGVLTDELNNRMGWTEIRFSHLSLMSNQHEEALASAEKGLGLVKGSKDYGGMLAINAGLMAKAQALAGLDRKTEARDTAREAVEQSKAFHDAFPDRYETRLAMSEAHLDFGRQLAALGEDEEALTNFGESADLLRQLLKEFPDSATFPMRIGENLQQMGKIATSKKDWANAQAWYAEDAAMWRVFQSYNPGDRRGIEGALEGYVSGAYASFNLGQREKMVEQLRASVDFLTGVNEKAPNEPEIEEALRVGQAMLKTATEGGDPFATAAAIAGNPTPDDFVDAGLNRGRMGAVLSRASQMMDNADKLAEGDDPKGAAAGYAEAAGLLHTLTDQGTRSREVLEMLAMATVMGGATSVDAGQFDQARSMLGDAVKLYGELAASYPDDPRYAQGGKVAAQTLKGLD